MRAQLPRARVAGADPLAHQRGPQAPGGADLGHVLEQVHVDVEVEREARQEAVGIHAARDEVLDVGEAVGEREGQLLGGRRPRLAHVVPADRHRVPQRHLVGAERDQVVDQPHRRPLRHHPLPLGDELLEDVGLDGAAQALPGHARPLGRDDEHGERDRRRARDRQRRRDRGQVDAVEDARHVVGRGDRDAPAADLALGQRVVRVVAHQGRHVEGDRETGLPLLEQVAEARVGVLGRAEAGEHPHRPAARPVHLRVQAAGVRVLARGRRPVGGAGGRSVDGLDGETGHRPVDRAHGGTSHPSGSIEPYVRPAPSAKTWASRETRQERRRGDLNPRRRRTPETVFETPRSTETRRRVACRRPTTEPAWRRSGAISRADLPPADQRAALERMHALFRAGAADAAIVRPSGGRRASTGSRLASLVSLRLGFVQVGCARAAR